MAKNPRPQCIRMKLLTQPATLETHKKSVDSLLLKVSVSTKHEDVRIKKPVQRKIIWDLLLVLCQFIYKWLRFS